MQYDHSHSPLILTEYAHHQTDGFLLLKKSKNNTTIIQNLSLNLSLNY